MSGPAHESMALVIVLPGSPVSHMLAKVGEQLNNNLKNKYFSTLSEMSPPPLTCNPNLTRAD